jgi:hypothetical protein
MALASIICDLDPISGFDLELEPRLLLRLVEVSVPRVGDAASRRVVVVEIDSARTDSVYLYLRGRRQLRARNDGPLHELRAPVNHSAGDLHSVRPKLHGVPGTSDNSGTWLFSMTRPRGFSDSKWT